MWFVNVIKQEKNLIIHKITTQTVTVSAGALFSYLCTAVCMSISLVLPLRKREESGIGLVRPSVCQLLRNCAKEFLYNLIHQH